ncbi:hypothetical protein [Paraburkholderia terricola]|uniref:Uncharacterized protein n=1 Tax=Paraburkholderia terricola TaxID=169427 RepID=A0ABU1M1A9_9BURK|nr:hypothetical protein [Paraburkholderia terricola]MDR6412808.1 hypothetical protein [Paraburkholderia terricola]MDR6484920.1 hypothetical protein [Paraburkholderia terricola]
MVKFLKILFPSIIVFFTLVAMSGSNYANTLEFKASAFPSTANGNPLVPEAIERTTSNNLIIAGHSGIQATVIKTDSKGNALWEYSLARLDDFPHAGVPEFRGVAVLPDDSIYLCGNMPRPPQSTAARAFVTHLDVTGRKLGEDFVAPATMMDGRFPLGQVTACTRWGDGIVLFGTSSVLNPAKSQGTLPTLNEFFWLLYLGQDGKVKWERLIPEKFYQYGLRNPFRPLDADMLVAATDGNHTKIFRFSMDGITVAQKTISGAFSFVRESSSNGVIHLIGTEANFSATASPSTHIIALDFNLNMTVGGGVSLPSVYGITYQLSNGRFVVIGGKNQEFGQRKTSTLTLIDRSTEEVNFVEFPFSHSPFADGGGVVAAVAGDSPGEFIAARFVTKVETNDKPVHPVPTGFKSGVVLDFFNLNK